MVTTTSGAYINTALIFLLRNPNYYQVSESEVGAVSSTILFWSIFISMLLAPLFGYSYDLLGRRFTLGMAFVLLSGGLFFVPYCSPSIAWLGVSRLIIMIGYTIVICHPLILDFVKKDSRGKATAFQVLGNVMGEIFAIAVLLNLTVTMKPENAFALTATCVFITGVMTLLLIQEPLVKKKKKSKLADSI